MKSFLFFVLFFCFGKSYGELSSVTAPKCLDIFPAKQSPAISNAILRGIRIFNSKLNPYQNFHNVFIHGTSVENVRRSLGPGFLGSPIELYQEINRLFSAYYPEHSALFSFYQGTTELDQNMKRYVDLFAEQAALKFYLLKALNIPEFYEPWFLDELTSLPEVTDALQLKNFLMHIVSNSSYSSLAKQFNSRISRVSFDFLFMKMQARRGVLVFIDGSVRTALPVEIDPDFIQSNAILSPRGVPWEYITAIVPQTQVERDELQRLLEEE